jgi:hypothetical protein
MAVIVGGIAVSHGPMLSTEPPVWDLRASADQKSPNHWYKGARYDYAALAKIRAPGFDAQVTREAQGECYDKCQQSLDRLADQFSLWNADFVLVVGNDQNEVFKEDLLPSVTVYTGALIENIAMDTQRRERLPPGIAEAEEGHCPSDGAVYPGLPDIANSLVASLNSLDFDVATSQRLPKGADRQEGIPHAFGFIYRRIMRDAPPPSIPVILNVAIGNNAIRIPRALALGRALTKAINALPADARVVVIASGGMSHFVVDEDLDRQILGALSTWDEGTLMAIPESHLNGNTSELKSWFVVAAAMKEAGLTVAQMDYSACYRTPAGTGSGMGFVTWK